MPFLSCVLGLLLLTCCLSSAWLLALELDPRARGSARLGAAGGLAYGLLLALFELLTSLGLFRVEVALGAWVLLTALLAVRGRARAARAARVDAKRAWVLARGLFQGGQRWVLLGLGLILGARFSRGLAAPPLAWDSLTYHLVKAGRWVQTGGNEPLLAPDAWGYYQFFLPYGDALWAWAMLPGSGDGFLAVAGLLIWVSVLVGAHALARALGARRRMALPAALGVAFLPAAVNSLTSAYVDNTFLALFLLGMAALVRSWRPGHASQRAVAVLALGVLAGIKPGGLPVFCLGLALMGFHALRSRPSLGSGLLSGLLVMSGVVLGLLPYLRMWVSAGSPLYPWPLSVAGVHLSEGNAQLAAIHSGELFGRPEVQAARVVKALLFSSFSGGTDQLGLGPALLLGVPGLLVAGRAVRRREGGVLGVFVCALSTVLGAMSPVLWSVWVDSSARFLLPMLAVLVVLVSLLRNERMRIALWVCLGVQGVLALPRGWSMVDLMGVLRVAPPLVLALGVSAVAFRRAGPLWGAGLAAMLLGVAWVPIATTREALRYEFYASAARGASFDLHPLGRRYVSSWPLWEELDGEAPRRLAVSAGWDGTGHNWYWYPLLGSRLQNTLTYVPVSPDGVVRDYARPRTIAGADYASWLRRLREADVDAVVTLPPRPIEARWMAEHPELFQPLASNRSGDGVVWRLLPEARP
ncbi:hypothetical protein [Melittangium boletus]|uniref:Glycosyltransferase RgtA/B/C/D-like domain-containing protein n=1 Tax=Melittangium boletus DSM 14713 TaxID=1294270 RepID=A0A250IPY1_9BACT|nr:hypothetical protein [Melittangium boletus]ATB33804.1 hypothetical protein MEBOL_007302 [Melittangium boletus DSM 14713]